MRLLERRRTLMSVLNKIINFFDISKVVFSSGYCSIKKENNSLVFTTGTYNTYPSTWTLNGFNIKPNTNYICRALVTEIDNGSKDPSWSASMRRSLKLQTLRETFDSKSVYIVNGSSGYKGADSEIITKFKTPADMTSYKYVVTRMADNMTVIFKDIVITEDS